MFELAFWVSIDDDDEDNKMEANLKDESKTYNSDDGKERSRRRGSCSSFREGVHEGGINESNEEGNVKRNSFRGNDRWEWWGSECELVVDVGVDMS